MAQKNINIVYNVDTQSIQVAKQQVDAAKQATDQLTQSAQRLSQQGSASAKDYAVTITALKDKIQIQKELIEDTARSDVKLMNDRIAKYKELQAELDKYNQSLSTSNKNIQDTGVSLASLGNTIRTVITAGLIKETISATLEMAKLAGQVEGVKRAFDKLPNSVLLMADLKEKTHGTLDELTLMQKAVQAQNFKIPLEQLGNLLEFAAVKAQQTGLDINYLTDSLITGLGRGSLKILDNLQFSITELKEKTKELGSQQAAVFFLVNEQMKKMGGYIENSGTSVKQLEADWKNLGITIAKEGAGIGNFFATQIDKSVKDLNVAIRAFSLFGNISPAALKFIADMDKRTEEATHNVQLFTKAHEGDTKAVEEEIKRLDELNTKERLSIIQAQHEGKKGEDGQMEAMERGIDVRKQTIKLLKDYRNQLELKEPDEKKQIGYLEMVDEQINQLNEDLKKLGRGESVKAVEIQVKIKQLESDKADFLDPDRLTRQAKATYKKINDEIAQDIHENSEKIQKGINKTVDDYNKALVADNKKANKMFIDGLKLEHKEAEKEEDEHQKRMNRIMRFAGQQIYSGARQLANMLVDKEVSKYDDQISALQEYYQRQEDLAGNNQKAKDKLHKEETRKQAKLEKERKAAQKKANIQRIEIDTAANVIRSIMENGGIPYGLPEGAIAAAMGIAEIALVNSYAKGVIDLKGPGTATSDSIPSMLSRGESVMTAEETRNSGNILRGIRSKKLNDQVLEKLTINTDGIVASMDLDPLIQEYRNNKAPDYARQFSVLYETKETRKGLKRIIRSKSFND